MEYKYPPIYKYIIFFIMVFMLIKHQKIMSQDKNLAISFALLVMIIVLDYIIIDKNPPLFEFKYRKKNNKKKKETFDNTKDEIFDEFTEEEIDELIDEYDSHIDEFD